MASDTRPSLVLQALPPLLLLGPAMSTHGPSLQMVSGLYVLVGLFSIFRVGYLLLRPDTPRRSLIRPAMAVVICTLILSVISYSLTTARQFAEETASRVQAECSEQGRCPPFIEDWWPRGDRYSSQTKYGQLLQWPILYHTDGQTFEVRMYKALDFSELWTGGVDNPLAKLRGF